jgi:hypothetical protein
VSVAPPFLWALVKDVLFLSLSRFFPQLLTLPARPVLKIPSLSLLHSKLLISKLRESSCYSSKSNKHVTLCTSAKVKDLQLFPRRHVSDCTVLVSVHNALLPTTEKLTKYVLPVPRLGILQLRECQRVQKHT